MINVILMNNKRIGDDLYRVIFRFFSHKDLLVRESNIYKIRKAALEVHRVQMLVLGKEKRNTFF